MGKPRQVENTRQVCQTVIDQHEDTVVTENSKEVITTQCTQASTVTSQSQTIVDSSTRLVKAGVPKPIDHSTPLVNNQPANSFSKRESKREAEADADAEGTNPYFNGEKRPFNPRIVAQTVPLNNVSPSVCSSVPVKECNKVPITTPRKVARFVCHNVVDVITIEDCHTTVTTACQHTTSHSAESTVVGHETNVIASGGSSN